jgi:hypothetical protein
MAGFLKNIFSVSTDSQSLGNQFRQKRMQFFNELIGDLPRPIRILDVGGNEQFWVNAGYHRQLDVDITILNLESCQTSYPNFHGVSGDATNLAQYGDNEFDIAFSNSVIEHLYSWENQSKMASEIERVGRFHYVQTPNRYFVIEPHYLLPYFQFLPKGLRYTILTKTRLSRGIKWQEKAARQYLDEIRLISKKEYKRLFPNSRIWKEKFVGLNKSFVAHNFPKNAG